ncbi:MAG: methylenetetrahydrofolate--tRNA-(uracil(54)-C(5))-methyltransferase (FADH(2)-oxidizing) TrmFO [Alphaproteobacteria bacterium]|jgi:methylenetetrahydrofolate--tRNA-(uracil-5-)-methyltransferase|nr:methylenetetrahydrofolate--tRNA-(uracil(54)-C(5))-methyltransferase (FADH(2)-oxidizing) TrmFO [Alphaproteobacteria bacterium]
MKKVHVIGGGLAGCEAAWQLAIRGVPVVLHEMRPAVTTPAHQSDQLAELVCSNSLRSDDSDYNAVGLLHDEMRRAGSLILRVADQHRLPAGGALAVDRDLFAADITREIAAHPLIEIVHGEVTRLDTEQPTIVASGPLTSDALAQEIRKLTSEDSLHFFDAIAPIIERESIDMSKAWMQSRYDKGDGSDYINCALDKEQYNAFLDALLGAEKVAFKEWEQNTSYFEGCLPIEIMAARGRETLRFGPMKPVGLTNPNSDRRPYAVIQLRQDNALGTLWNIVGFQTKMKYGEQERVFRMIPGLEQAAFARLGGIHRNTFINSPKLLGHRLELKAHPAIRFAGQVMGVEGYVESASMGFLAGLFAAAEVKGEACPAPPRTTALGALLAHVTGDAEAETFQPMNVNFSLFPPITSIKGRERKRAYTQRAKEDLSPWIDAITSHS